MPPVELDTITRVIEKLPSPPRNHYPPELIAILAKSASALDWIELEATISECIFSDAVRMLPAALRLMIERPGDFPQLANAVIRFCKRDAHELAALGISEEVTSLSALSENRCQVRRPKP